MPLLSTPRIVARFRTSPVPGMTVPTGANTAFMPACTLGAPHTTSTTCVAGLDPAHAEPLGVGVARAPR